MAAFDDTSGTDLEVYAGQTWSAWQSATESEDGSGDELGAVRQDNDVARLKRKDLGLFGYCPAKDNFYVVVCEHCHLPFKPQVFHHHMEKQHKKKSRIAPLAFQQEDTFIPSSVVKSSALVETRRNPSSFVGRMTKKPDKASLSYAIMQALQKVSSPPTGSKPSSSIRSSFPSSKHKNTSLSGKQSPTLLSDNKTNNNFTSSKCSLSVKETNKADKRKLKYDHSCKHAKVHKNNFVLQTKPHKVKSENIKKINEGSNLHHNHRRDHGSTSSSSTVAIKNLLHNQSNVPAQSKSSRNKFLGQPLSHKGPIVVLEKSPELEKTALEHVHVKVRRTECEKGKASSLDQSMKSTTPHSSHKNKRNHDPELGILKSADRDGGKDAIPLGKLCKSKSKKSEPVKGRTKPFDELLTDLTCANRTTNGKPVIQTSTSSQGADLGTPPSVNIRVPLPSPPPPVIRSQPELSTFLSSQNKQVSSAGKAPLRSSSKTKNSIHLFPRPKVPRHIDNWKDEFIDSFDENVKADQLVMNRHPAPISVQRYGSRAMGSGHTVYNKKADFQWKSVLSIFRNKDLKNTRKPSFLSLSGSFKTDSSFNPLPSVSRSFLTCLKNSKTASERQKQQCPNEPECNTVFVGKNSIESYANNFLHKKTLQQRQVRCQRHQLKSLSVDENSLPKRTSAQGYGKFQRNERNTIDSLPGPPSPKSQRCSVPEHRTVSDEHLKVPTSLHGKFVQLSTTSTNLTVSSDTHNFNLNSYLAKEQSTMCSSQSETGSSISSGTTLKLPNSFLPHKSSKVKRLITGRKNSTKHHSSTSHPGTARGNHGTLTGSFADGSNHESHLLNGLSSATHVWPHSVTLSGSIGALMNTNAATVDEASSTRIPFDLDQQGLSSGGAFVKQISHNANNSNNVKAQRNNCRTSSSTTVQVNRKVALTDDLQSLLYYQNNISSSTTNCQLVTEATGRTTHPDVIPVSVEKSTTTVESLSLPVSQDFDVADDWTTDFLSLLCADGDVSKHKEAISSHDLTFFLRENGLILSDEKASIAK